MPERPGGVPEVSEAAVKGVTCPHCGAPPGSYCHSRGGWTVPPHKARQEAALPSDPLDLDALERRATRGYCDTYGEPSSDAERFCVQKGIEAMRLAVAQAREGWVLVRPDDPELVERMARLFHENYEQLAPAFGYATREESRTPWPPPNADLMRATVNASLAAAFNVEEGERDG